MNNFAISTSDLAQGLQKAAGTLTVAGNTIEESMALITAGNTIMQDVASVSAGVKTISLRLVGTESAKEELEELGEDVEDFQITTTSKLAEQIEYLTAVNGEAGVSILDMNGNYKSTYEILSEISQLWSDIAEQDLKDGNNRQQALLELMANFMPRYTEMCTIERV